MPQSIPLLLAALLWSCVFLLPPQLVHGAPIKPPDLRKCQTATAQSIFPPPLSLTFHCCLPSSKKTVTFSFKRYPPVKKIRRPAHKADQQYIKKYERAYELMRALPSHDPRSFAVQANIHCAFCNGAYTQPGSNITLQIHYSWLFMAWHRWYLYFHERILASLVGDPKFSLLFWNWDNQEEGNVMPHFFAEKGTALYDSKRNPDHLSPALVRLNVLSTTTDPSDIIAENLNAMYHAMVTASTAELFLGGAYRAGTNTINSSVLDAPLGGSIENGVHNAVHSWTGDPRQPLGEDMGVFGTAARDPIFFAHHSNIDRLWDVWRKLPGGRREDHTDPDFLDAEFIFYDEKANLVKVKIRDALDSKKLGIGYERVKADELWKNYQPQRASSNATDPSKAEVQEIGPASEKQTNIEVGERLSALVSRPPALSTEALKSRGVKGAEELAEVLVLQGVEVPRERFMQLRVFINLPDADEDTSTRGAEFVGFFNVVPYVGNSEHLFVNVKLEIGDNIKRLGLEKAEKVVITIVVKAHDGHPVDVKLHGIQIEYLG